MGISVDSQYSHAAFAAAVGGIAFPLLQDFQPKGAVASSFGLYLEEAGITDRATVIIDAGGTIRYLESVTPAGKRDMNVLLEACREIDASWSDPLVDMATPEGLPDDLTLYVRDNCMFSRWALYTRSNLHLQDRLNVRNVSQDAEARSTLESKGGKAQAPALDLGDQVLYESADIAAYLSERCALP